MSDQCDWKRVTARVASIIFIIVNSIYMAICPHLMLMAFNAIQVYPPPPAPVPWYEVFSRTTGTTDALAMYWYDLYKECREIGAQTFVISFVLGLASLGLNILLYLATDKQRATTDSRWCYTWVIAWLVFECLQLVHMHIDMDRRGHGHSTSNLSGHRYTVTYICPAMSLYLVMIPVIPYALELNRRDVQIYNVTSRPMTQYPSIPNSSPGNSKAKDGRSGGNLQFLNQGYTQNHHSQDLSRLTRWAKPPGSAASF